MKKVNANGELGESGEFCEPLWTRSTNYARVT